MSLPTPVPLRDGKKTIPKKELLSWVETNVDTEGAEIIKVRDALLWSKGDVERHRLDVFEKYYPEGEGEFCWTNRIGERSFFLHYHKAEKTITDRTVGRYVGDNKGIF
tara:strand:+ start:37 stop:360 length:324 start_codon:yes stop_codon:yes gene_type:complete